MIESMKQKIMGKWNSMSLKVKIIVACVAVIIVLGIIL